jgi:hypothetical protein
MEREKEKEKERERRERVTYREKEKKRERRESNVSFRATVSVLSLHGGGVPTLIGTPPSFLDSHFYPSSCFLLLAGTWSTLPADFEQGDWQSAVNPDPVARASHDHTHLALYGPCVRSAYEHE